MSTNCIRCVMNKRTGIDLLCDQCRALVSPNRDAANLYTDKRLKDCIVLTDEKLRVWFASEVYAAFHAGANHARKDRP